MPFRFATPWKEDSGGVSRYTLILFPSHSHLLRVFLQRFEDPPTARQRANWPSSLIWVFSEVRRGRRSSCERASGSVESAGELLLVWGGSPGSSGISSDSGTATYGWGTIASSAPLLQSVECGHRGMSPPDRIPASVAPRLQQVDITLRAGGGGRAGP